VGAVNELFVQLMWAAMAARIAFLAFWGRATTLAPVMSTLRRGMLPITASLVAFAPFTQAHGTPGQASPAGASLVDPPAVVRAFRDGVSLDEAVSRAEQQYRARVVRTEVQDEDGRTVYVLKLLSENGRVFTVRIDAATGRMR
jgi:hypothetical protein